MDILKEQLNRSKELMGILNEQTEDETNELEEIVVYDETQEQVDGEGIQGLDEGNELNDTDLSNVSENEDDWVKGSWDELDSEIKNIYKKTEEFEGCLEDGDDIVNEQRSRRCSDLFGNMGESGLRKFLRKLFGWFPRLRWPRFMRKLSGLEKDVQGIGGTPGKKWRQY